MTPLSKPVSRETAKRISGRNVILTIAPLGGQLEAQISFRLKGKRTQYTMTVSDGYRMAALWYANKEKSARSSARKMGVPWKRARKSFIAENCIN